MSWSAGTRAPPSALIRRVGGGRVDARGAACRDVTHQRRRAPDGDEKPQGRARATCLISETTTSCSGTSPRKSTSGLWEGAGLSSDEHIEDVNGGNDNSKSDCTLGQPILVSAATVSAQSRDFERAPPEPANYLLNNILHRSPNNSLTQRCQITHSSTRSSPAGDGGITSPLNSRLSLRTRCQQSVYAARASQPGRCLVRERVGRLHLLRSSGSPVARQPGGLQLSRTAS